MPIKQGSATQRTRLFFSLLYFSPLISLRDARWLPTSASLPPQAQSNDNLQEWRKHDDIFKKRNQSGIKASSEATLISSNLKTNNLLRLKPFVIWSICHKFLIVQTFNLVVNNSGNQCRPLHCFQFPDMASAPRDKDRDLFVTLGMQSANMCPMFAQPTAPLPATQRAEPPRQAKVSLEKTVDSPKFQQALIGM